MAMANNNLGQKVVRIGGGSGFWGDSPEGPRQLVMGGDIHYLVLDYLAEITMSILARAKARKPELGYATDFVTQVVGPLAQEIAARGIKVVTNAGGCNPQACAEALRKELSRRGVSLRVAAVLGDDVLPFVQDQGASVREMFTGEPMPAGVLTANAYLGAFPIARALADGADIVVTGRCADSAVALGPLIHEFGWSTDDWDRLAAGSLVGHVLECGTQATGGISTDWKDVAADWDRMGYPIAECEASGVFTLTKPPGTGGRVSYSTVAEQVTYEIGDPSHYLLPDVVVDLSQVCIEEVGVDRVRVSNVRGKPPTGSLKVSATIPDGFRSLTTLFVRGIDAADKARAMGHALLKRSRRLMREEGFDDYAEVSVEVLGAEEGYGAEAAAHAWREVVLKIAVRHADENALAVFAREIFPAATSMAQGISGIFGGRPKVQPVMRLFSFLVPKASVAVQVLTDGQTIDVPFDLHQTSDAPAALAVAQRSDSTADAQGPMRTVKLVDLCYARSGDKGDASNIAVFVRKTEWFPWVARQLTSEAVAQWMAHLVKGKVIRYPWPGLNGFNFLLESALGGGGVASLRYDPQGKSHSQILLEFPITLPESVLNRADGH